MSRLRAIREWLASLARDEPTLLVTCAFLGALTIATALYTQAWGDRAEAFAATGPGRLWVALVLFQAIVWVVVVVVIWRNAAWLRVERRAFWTRFAIVLVVIGLFFALLLIAEVPQAYTNQLPGWEGRIRYGAALVAAVAVSWGATHGICLHASTERRRRDIGRDLADDARDYRLRQRTLEMLLWVVAAVVSLAVAVEAAGGAAADAYCDSAERPRRHLIEALLGHRDQCSEFQPEAVIAVGIAYSLVAAAVYLPARFALEQLGRDLLSRWTPLPAVSPAGRATDEVVEWVEGRGGYERAAAERDAAGRLLGVGGGASQTALTAFGILSPLVVALLSAAL